MKYRILERLGEFTIQVKDSKVVGMWWWSREVPEYVRADSYGYPLKVYSHVPNRPPMKSFKTIEKAKEKIEQLRKGGIIHFV